MQTFTDLVGAAVVPAHCFDTTELTDLTPALDTVTAVNDLALQASDAAVPTFTPAWKQCPNVPGPLKSACDFDTNAAQATLSHDTTAQASEARSTNFTYLFFSC